MLNKLGMYRQCLTVNITPGFVSLHHVYRSPNLNGIGLPVWLLDLVTRYLIINRSSQLICFYFLKYEKQNHYNNDSLRLSFYLHLCTYDLREHFDSLNSDPHRLLSLPYCRFLHCCCFGCGITWWYKKCGTRAKLLHGWRKKGLLFGAWGVTGWRVRMCLTVLTYYIQKII